jgi:hypothetical protein
LHILTNVHNLHQIFETVMTSISQFIDVEIDPFYKKGVKKGEAIGIVKGEAIGRAEEKVDLVVNFFLKTDFNDVQIAAFANISVSTVTKLRLMVQEFPENYKVKMVYFLLNNAK